MISIYFILKRIKQTFFKKYIDYLNHSYPVFAGVPFLELMTYKVTGMHRECTGCKWLVFGALLKFFSGKGMAFA